MEDAHYELKDSRREGKILFPRGFNCQQAPVHVFREPPQHFWSAPHNEVLHPPPSTTSPNPPLGLIDYAEPHPVSAAFAWILQSLGIPICVYIDDSILAGRRRTIKFDQYLTRLFCALSYIVSNNVGEFTYALVAQPTAGDKSEDVGITDCTKSSNTHSDPPPHSVIKRMLVALGMAYTLRRDSFTLAPKETLLIKIQKLGEKIIGATARNGDSAHLLLDDLRKLLGTAVAASPLSLTWMGSCIVASLNSWCDERNFRRMSTLRSCRKDLNWSVKRLLNTWETLAQQCISNETPTTDEADANAATIVYYDERAAAAVETREGVTRIRDFIEIVSEETTSDDDRWALAMILTRIMVDPPQRGIVIHPNRKAPTPRRDHARNAIDPIWISAALTMGSRRTQWINRYSIPMIVRNIMREIRKIEKSPIQIKLHPQRELRNTIAFRIAENMEMDEDQQLSAANENLKRLKKE